MYCSIIDRTTTTIRCAFCLSEIFALGDKHKHKIRLKDKQTKRKAETKTEAEAETVKMFLS